ncbi:MAG TPA: TatD family hydrolase [Dehalococcoidia bacterium]|nr:TatD family hydrolase [Dehalococcoidia bacterium]
MLLVDAHCHLQDRQFEADRSQVLARAREAGVRAFVVVGWDLDSSRQAVDLADEHPDVYAVIGVHPHYASRLDGRTLRALRRLADSAKVVAIGETGLDFYRNLSPPDDQRRAFRAQLELAAELRLPVVVHSRDADQETFAVLSQYERAVLPDWPHDRPLGQMHCFAGDLSLALRYVQMGFLISVPATCTYPKSERICTVARGLPLRWLTVETDAPYLPPQGRRGQRNEPAFLPETVEAIARMRGEEPSRVASGTALAAAWLFGLGDMGEGEGA